MRIKCFYGDEWSHDKEYRNYENIVANTSSEYSIFTFK